MFVILTNRVDQKQATVAENKLFCLKKYVPQNISPDLPVAWNIIRSVRFQKFNRSMNWRKLRVSL